MSKLVLNTGCMFSGKSTELLRQGERYVIAGQKVLYIKPDMDTRYSDEVSVPSIITHNGKKVEALAVPVDCSLFDYVPRDIKVILIDEVQFFDKFIVKEIMALVNNGVSVYISGLDTDFNGHAFEITAELMALADYVNKYHAVCIECGSDALYSAKKGGDRYSRLEVGEKDKYIPLCRKCYRDFIEKRRF